MAFKRIVACLDFEDNKLFAITYDTVVNRLASELLIRVEQTRLHDGRNKWKVRRGSANTSNALIVEDASIFYKLNRAGDIDSSSWDQLCFKQLSTFMIVETRGFRAESIYS